MMCSTAPSMSSATIEQRLDSPRGGCNSPSSISDVEFGLRRRDENEKPVVNSNQVEDNAYPASFKSVSEPVSGDEAAEQQDGSGAVSSAEKSAGINDALAHPVSSSASLKRKAEDLEDSDQATKKSKVETETESVGTPASYVWTDDESPSEETVADPLTRAADDFAPGCDEVDTTDVECSSASPRRRNRRTLYIEYWSRTDECKERKWDHLDEIADKYGSAEEHIFATTLKGRTAFLEPNMFPYDTPAGIEHWTLWHMKELNHEQVKQYVENWIDANAPHVERWNYDDNPERSIDIFHVHVYFQVAEGSSVLQGRKVEDLVHELD